MEIVEPSSSLVNFLKTIGAWGEIVVFCLLHFSYAFVSLLSKCEICTPFLGHLIMSENKVGGEAIRLIRIPLNFSFCLGKIQWCAAQLKTIMFY